MTIVAEALACAMAALLLWAALEKARNPRAIVATIRGLGIGDAVARPMAIAIMLAELLIASALLLRPDAKLTQWSVIALAALFAIAGLVALRLDHPVPCSCFAVGGNGRLGIRQLIAFVPWTAAASMLRFGVRETLATGAASFAVIALGIAGVHALLLRERRRVMTPHSR
ncbi:MAG TPA: MauE/DoxX family redox-associated membrane protein [Thermoanaerobaculia bacterium]|nr:MauE/DoxX family redox-associated membrane protein [Thermoanaerobaculia bacterium]